jgi:hypothetical protein
MGGHEVLNDINISSGEVMINSLFCSGGEKRFLLDITIIN